MAAFLFTTLKQILTAVHSSAKSNHSFLGLGRLLVALGILAFGFFFWFYISTRPVTYSQTSPVEFEIKTGWGVDRIGQELSAMKLIRSRSAFKITVVTLGISNKIQAGFFRLSPDMSLTDIAKALTHATVRQVRVTIPEGLRRQEIAVILEKAFKEVDGAKFATSEFLSLTESKEGRLFPDTYDFDPKSDTRTIIGKFDDRFIQIADQLKISTKNTDRIIIIASLLEREAANSDEMPEIAGVIENRLQASWPLQIDATVQYALSTAKCKKLDCDWWPKSLSKADLQYKSSYNTYINQGLPPKPISNPGKSALAAAANPKTTSAWFYLHDNNGQIHFANTIEQHNQNVCTYLQKDCQ
ncbi:MAG TPA: endolytic transglycosylase MltG [Candidatus Woesebacteria bacterium]|nr:endolytic transglycosylase MltG [Candidatus Woesebacteria bacterium]